MNEKYPKTLNRKLRTSWGRWISIFLLLCLFQADAQAYISYAHYAIQKSRIEKSEAVANTSTSTKVSSDAGCKVACSHGMPSWESLSSNFSAVTGGSHSHIPISVQVDTTKTVGEIPYQSGTTPTGGVTYTVPVEVAPGRGNMQPELSITYNSQGGNSALGYGWGISGLSAISKVAKNHYYNSAAAPVSLSTSDALTLDGMRLLPTGVANQFELERGNMRITGNVYSGDYRSFTVEYPNGMVGIYGFPSGTTKQLSFPITRLTDALGNYMDFTYEQVDGQYYVTKIAYGAHSSSAAHLAEVVFTYTSRPDASSVYEAGKEIRFSRLLSKIECKNGGDVLHTYTFTYDADSDVSLLQNLGCDNLNPLRFYYGYADNEETNVVCDEVQLPSGFSGDVVAFKCKLRAGAEEDALVVYPTINPTAVSGNGKYYYSAFDANQPLLVYKSLSGSSPVDYRITAGAGFQTLLAADVDGVPGDEIIKINNTASGNIETLTVDFYSSNTVVYLGKVNGKTFTYNSTAFTGGSIWPKRFLTGDFLGTGKAQLFAITIDKPLKKDNVHSFAYLFDAYAGQTLYTGKPFNYDMYDDLFAADVNGDGKVELCHIHQTGMDVYAFSDNAVCTKLFTVPEINQELFYTKKFFVGDVNGDGKCDVVISPELSYYRDVSREVHAGAFETCFDCGALYPYEYCWQCHKWVGRDSRCIKCGESLDWQGACEEHGELFWLTETEYFDNGSIWTIYYGNGKGFTKKNSGYVCTYEATKNFCLQDVNSDGAADLIVGYNKWEKTQSKIVRYYFSKDSTFVRSSAVSIENDMRLVPSDIAIPNYYNFLLAIKDGKLHRINYTTNKAKQRLLTGMANSLGVVQHNYYLRLNEEDPSVSEYFYTKDWDAKYPYNDYEGPLWAVARQKVFADSVRVSDLAYQYEGAIMHRQGLGFRGFKKIHTEDWLRYAETSVHTYNPLQYGIPVSVETDKEKENYTYDVSVATNKKLKANMTGKVSVNKLTGVTTTGSYLYDNYGNCLSETMAYSDGTSAPTAEERKVHLCLNQTTSGRYLIGLPLEETHILERGNEEWREQEEITYQANTPLPIKRITRVYDSDDMVYKTGETRYTYDAYGNVLTKKQGTYNSTNFVGDTYTYDANGRYLSTVTDALGRTTTYHTYNKWGKPASATNHLGKQTTYAYDALGRNTTTIAADGTTQSVSYLWNPGKGVFGILKSATGSPDELVCYDVLKREVRRGQQRFDGNWMYVDKEYDEYGLLERESLPFKGSAASKWNIYTYDGYDRLTKVNEASGKQTTYSYLGNSVTTTEKGISTTRTNNAVGELVKVSDSSGEAVYHYRADGQLSDIVAPGNVVTSFEYDVYGRKTKLVDPSAGTQTYTETNHTDGSRTTTQTDAKGLATTMNYDAYGRVTSVNRPEFNTSYTYDAVTKKLKSEVSTNGTKKEYTYDAYGRLSVEKETVDNVWLQKGYTYANGNVSKVSYSSSKEGSIGEENLLYVNGSLNEVKLGTTSVWKLTAENELGQPTGGVTGPLTRTYGYTEFGLPTMRKAGSLQHFTYNFDANTGNLLSRTDATRNLTEQFTYDALNRLTGYGTKTVTYANNGNITAKSDAGSLSYTHESKPYAVTGATATGISQSFAYNASGDRIEKNDAAQQRLQEVTYNSLMRPATLTEGGNTATFLYDANGERKKMTVSQNGTVTQTKYYLSDQYETDDTKTLLYINGNAYSSPIVYVKESGQWKIYYICRDYLGSITHLVNADGSLAQELSYDAWGRLRNPQTQEVYGASAQPVLKLGRGYTGHEHLSLFGLVNMNARLYDPVLGRFLSPDPYVQMPDNLQNLNRYSYCLNNPLAYVDEDGELWWFVVAAIVGAYIGGVSSNHGELNPVQWDYSSPSTYLSMGLGALCGYVGAYGIANPGTVGYLFGVSSSYVSVGIGVTAAGTSVGAIGSGTNWKFDLQWSTAAGGGGSFNIGTAHSGKDEGNTLRLDDGSEWDFSPYAYASAVSLGLLADDATLFGAVDDVLIPVAYGVATYSFVKNNSDLIAKETREIADIMKRNLSLKQGFVYELHPKVDGYYRNVRGGQVYLTEKDVWKIGETTQGVDRYNVNSYERKNFDMIPIYYGNKMEILIQEKRMIYGYFFRNGTLPPGNRIFR